MPQSLEHRAFTLGHKEAYRHRYHGHHLGPVAKLLVEKDIAHHRREQRTKHHSYDGREQHPRAHHHDKVPDAPFIALLQQFARLARGIERYAQIAAAHHKLHDRVVDGNQPHAVSAQEGRCELVAHHRCEHLEHLYAAKDAGVFEHVVV